MRFLVYFLVAAAALGSIMVIGKLSIFEIESATPTPPIAVPPAIDRNFSDQVDQCFIPTAAVYGYTLRVSSGWRSLAEQGLIYQSGRIIDGHIVSEASAGRSIHNYGYAVDITDRWRGYNINWPRLVAIGAYCGLEHDDNDLPHFEYRGGLSTDDFILGRRPAPLTLPCPAMAERASASEALMLKDLRSCGAPDFGKVR